MKVSTEVKSGIAPGCGCGGGGTLPHVLTWRGNHVKETKG